MRHVELLLVTFCSSKQSDYTKKYCYLLYIFSLVLQQNEHFFNLSSLKKKPNKMEEFMASWPQTPEVSNNKHTMYC